MASATKKAKKFSRDPLVSTKQKIFEIAQSLNNPTQLAQVCANNDIVSHAGYLDTLVLSGKESIKKDQNKGESYIASGCAVLQRKTARKPRKKDFEDAAALIHKGLMLLPPGDTTSEKTLESAYHALSQIYSVDNLKNQQRFEMYSMMWLRKCAHKSSDRRHLVEVQYTAVKLFESYGKVMKKYMTRLATMGQAVQSQGGLPKQMSKLVADIRKVRAKAEECLLAEAIADFQTRPRLFSVLLSQYKEIKSTLNRDFSAFDSFTLQPPSEFQAEKSNRTASVQAVRKSPPAISNILLNVMIDLENSCLRARRTINSGQVIFYEPVLVSNWATVSQHCGQCSKPIPFGGTPCSKCSRISFCSERCSNIAQEGQPSINRHSSLSCNLFKGFKLSKNAALVYDLMTKSSPDMLSFVKAILQRGNFNIKALNDAAVTQATLALNMLVIFICKRAAHLNASLGAQTAIDPWLIAEMFHLDALFKNDPFNNLENNVSLVELYYKLLYYFKISPQANVHLEGSKGGFALGAFGGGLLEYSCTPNTRRQLNSKTGNIDYLATHKIELGEVLTVSRSYKKTPPTGAKLKAELDKYLLTCICTKCSPSSNNAANP